MIGMQPGAVGAKHFVANRVSTYRIHDAIVCSANHHHSKVYVCVGEKVISIDSSFSDKCERLSFHFLGRSRLKFVTIAPGNMT